MIVMKMHNVDGADQVLDELIATRHSVRGFLPDPLPAADIDRFLESAQRAPSWCNVQPWRTYLLSGAAVSQLTERLMAARDREPAFDLPEPVRYTGEFRDRRRESGFALYASLGIRREDTDRRLEQAWENYRFFGAPHVAIVTSTTELGPYAFVDTGVYLAHLLLVARSRGWGAIAQAAIAGRADVVRDALVLPSDEAVVAAVSFGRRDDSHPANGFRTSRVPIDEVVRHVDRLD